MADETKRIEALYGPHAGRRLDVPADVAAAAIADGWARDPFAPAEEAKEVKEMTAEDRQKVLEAAHKADRKLRGEEDADNGKKAKKEDRSMEADKPAGYEIRSTLPKSK
jgi:hypothetical protein